MRVLTVVGARPQFIKATLLSLELEARGIEECLVHTGQHYDYNMSKVFFQQLRLKDPDFYLDVGSASHAVQTAEIMKRLEPIVVDMKPDWVVVFGDTNSTLGGALVASKLGVPLAHVEAGLRSFNRRMPEEINRVVADHLADAHFAPNELAARQLKDEGIHGQVEIVGDLMIDLLEQVKSLLPERPDILKRFHLRNGEFAVVTIHRASNTDDEQAFHRIVIALRSLGMSVVFPVHPRTRPLVERYQVGTSDNIVCCDPLSFIEMIALQRESRVILTDSGGVQKEAYALAVPCVTLRDETEWVETLENGWNVLTGSNTALIEEAARRPKPSIAPLRRYGDGTAGRRIVDALCKLSASRGATDQAARRMAQPPLEYRVS